jgi:hypothetical protein
MRRGRRESRRPENARQKKPHAPAPMRAGLGKKNFDRRIKRLFDANERRPVDSVAKGEIVEAELTAALPRDEGRG